MYTPWVVLMQWIFEFFPPTYARAPTEDRTMSHSGSPRIGTAPNDLLLIRFLIFDQDLYK